MDFRSNSVLSESTNFIDFELLPANTQDKIKSVIVPTTIVERLRDDSNWLWPTHNIEEVAVERVSKKNHIANIF